MTSPNAQKGLIAACITAVVISFAINGYLLLTMKQEIANKPHFQITTGTVPNTFPLTPEPSSTSTSSENSDTPSTTIINVGQLMVDWTDPRKLTETEMAFLLENKPSSEIGESNMVIGTITKPSALQNHALVLSRIEGMGGPYYRYFAYLQTPKPQPNDIKQLITSQESDLSYDGTLYQFTLGAQQAKAKNGFLFSQSVTNTRYSWDVNSWGFGGKSVQIDTTASGLPIYRTLGTNEYSVLLKSGLVLSARQSLIPESVYSISAASLDLTIPTQANFILGGLDMRGSGCGIGYSAAYVDSRPVDDTPPAAAIFTKSDLKKISATKEIYQVTNLKHPAYTAAYEQWYSPEWAEGKKPTMEEFLKQKPLPFFLYKDAMGYWTAYTAEGIAAVAECGKPVIYLYPTTTSTVQVKLPSFVDVTVSEPSYPAQGWTTTATPDGKLTMKDGKTYGSLFWEGYGATYPTPTTGFIVKGENIESFLSKTLAQYGMNAQESKDFMEFWVPLMKKYPTMRVSFVTDDWHNNVPLNVTPQPDTNIRIFMDWSPVSSDATITEPAIKTPTRKGFTLVEWGGLLRK